ncbi:hypothetical protein ACLB1E_10615 [Escherichia coli]
MKRWSPVGSCRALRPSTGLIIRKVLSYLDVLRDKAPVGNKVAIIGCGGIGFDTAMYLSQPGESTSQNRQSFVMSGGSTVAYNRLVA